MKKFYLLLSLLMVSSFFVQAQEYAKYWVAFSNKKETPHTIEYPQTFLSQKAILKRIKRNIPITTQDLPVAPQYVKQVLALSPSNQLLSTSKWLNGITIYSEDENIVQKLTALPFVKFVEKTITMNGPDTIKNQFTTYYNEEKARSSVYFESDKAFHGYGSAQIAVNNGQWLHRMGYSGDGMTMMILDGGFTNVDSNSFFSLAYEDGRVRGVKNFVQTNENPYHTGDHGAYVWSVIASYHPGVFIGTAPAASFYLAQSEDPRSEYKVEEDNWVAAIEWADSLGVDVVNSSLGYTIFDDATQNRAYSDLNGQVSRASQAATLAAQRGMIICNSAGNSGTKKDWYRIGFPSEAKDILAVGAVDAYRRRAPFSSYGPTADGRVKPDAVAVGWNTFASTLDGNALRLINGTSFSSPLLAGLVTCLWQAFPEKSNYEIMEAVRISGDQFHAPDTSLGYGITDFLKAYNHLARFDAKDEIIPRFSSCKNYCVTTPYATFYYTTPNKEGTRVQVEVVSLKNKQKMETQVLKAKNGYSEFRVKLPKLKKEELYNIYRVTLTCGDFTEEYTIAQEHKKDKEREVIFKLLSKAGVKK